MTFEATPPRVFGPAEYGSEYDVRRWLEQTGRLRRTGLRCLVAWDGGRPVGLLPLCRIEAGHTPGAMFADEFRQLGLAAGEPNGASLKT